jgi:hypothetical protein
VAAALAVLILLAAAALGIRAAARALRRPLPAYALAAFVLLSLSPYPLAYVTDRTPLPLDHVGFLPPWTIPGQVPRNPYLNDIATQILPWTEAVRLAWEDGAAPFRDRWNGCGTPLAANSVSAAFLPTTWVAVFLPLARAFALSIAVKLLLAATGMFLWVRELRASSRAAGYAAVAFALSFSFLPPWILYPQSGVFCLWPWVLFLLERCRDPSGRGRAVVALGAVFVLIVLAGHPESAALGFLFAALLLVGRRLAGDLPDLAAVARSVVPAAAAALVLTAFLLVPSLFAIAASGRLAVARTPYWAPLMSLAPHAPVWRGILPAFFPATLGNGIGSPTVPGGTGTFTEMAMGYAGILSWMAAFLVVRPGARRPRVEVVLWILALVGFGQAVCLWPVAEIFARLPAFRWVFPLRFNGWVALALPAIAALEIDRLEKDRREGARGSAAVALSAALLAAAGVWLYAYLFDYRRIHGGLPFQRTQLAVVLGALAIAVTAARFLRPAALAGALTLVTAGELLYQWHVVNRLDSPERLFPDTPLLRFLRAQPGPFRVAGAGPMLFPSTNVFARLEDIRTHDAVERHDYLKFLDATCGYPSGDYFKKLRNLDATALDFLNVRYLLATPGVAAPGARWKTVYEGPDGVAFENAGVLPRAFVPARVRRIAAPRGGWPVADAASAFGEEFGRITATADWRATASILADGTGDSENPPARVSRYAESTNAAAFDAAVPPGPSAVVVLSLVQDGGWSARDEDGPLPVFLANGPFLAVEVPLGEHRVRPTYAPPGWRAGVLVSLGGVAALAGLATERARRRRRRTDRSAPG